MQTDREPNDSPQPDSKDEPILSTPAYTGTEARLRVFLETYAKTGRVMRSCEAAGIGFNVHYRRLLSDATYRAVFEEVEQCAAQALEDVLYDRAMAGDVQAALALLRRFRPSLYRERTSVEVSGSLDLADRLAQARARMSAGDRLQ